MNRQVFGVDVAKLRERRIELDIRTSPQALELEVEDCDFAGDLTGRLVYSMSGADIFVKGLLKAPARGRCVRCLGPAEMELNAGIELTFAPSNADDEPEPVEEPDEALIDHYRGDFFDPSPQLRELLLLEMPPLPLCRPDCRGLCPHCGANRNTEPCACPDPAPEERFEPIPSPSESWKQTLRNLRLED